MSNDERLQSTNFNRPPRLQFPRLPEETIDIPAPPTLPDLPNQNWFITIIPVMGMVVMVAFYILRAADNSSSAFFAIPLLFLALFTIGGTLLAQRWRRRDYERRRHENTLNYIRLLEKKRVRLQAAYDAKMALLEANFPNAQEALNLALSRDSRLWERRPDDPDFVSFRLGVGVIPSQIRINTPNPDLDSEELERALALADSYRYLYDAPVVASLQQHHALGMCGNRSAVLKAVRSAVCHLAVTHAPQDLHVYLISSQANYADWDWLEYLPHASQNQRGGASDLIAFDSDNIHNLLGNLSQVVDERKEHQNLARTPHLLLIVDGPQLAESESVYSTILREGSLVGASAICLVNNYINVPSDCQTIVEIESEGRFRFAQAGVDGFEIFGNVIDQLSTQDAEHIARVLASVTVRDIDAGGRIPRRVDFLDLYGARYVEDLREMIAERWRRPIPKGVLPHPVPIGRESLTLATEILLDEDHHGPHGVLAGTTGSGKSELLQTLICGLAIEHDPRLVNFLLIDFKGGSTFNIFSKLPHTVGAVTNLDGAQVERALEALKAETKSRQQFFKKMNVRDITQYHRYFARTAGHVQDLEYQPLPHLFIIVDEYAQLAKEMPDFLRELVRTAQVGRSLGLHLILGTQSPMDVITDEMNANLQFRICLRVQNIEASRAMLRRPDAAYLPAGWPGRGYLQVGERGTFKQFQTAYVGGDYQPQTFHEDDEQVILELITNTGDVINLLPETHSSHPSVLPNSPLGDEPYTTVRAIVETIADYAKEQQIPKMPPLLLPPLEERISLKTAYRKLALGGWNGREWSPAGRDHEGNPIKLGSAPVGLVDDVYSRTQNPLWIHLNTGEQEQSSAKDGHVLIIGGPGTGKTTFLRTLAVSQALLHPPTRLHMYFLSFTGGGLNELGSLPHSESVVHGTETERVRRLFRRLIQALNERQAHRVEAVQPTMVVVIDQYEQFRDTYYEQHMADFERLINEGRAVGIYLVLTVSGITAVPERLRSLVPQRIALQLGNPADYLLAVGHLNTRIEGALAKGRGFLAGSPPLMCQISLPSNQSIVDDDDDAFKSMVALVKEMRSGYLKLRGIRESDALLEQMQMPAPLRELPTKIPLDTLPIPRWNERTRLVTGLGRCDDDALSVYNLDWWEDGPHFLVTGPPGSGKTNLLHAAVLSAAQQYTPRELRFLLVDFSGRSLRALDGLKHVIGRATNLDELQAHLEHLQADLDSTREGDFPKTVVIIDDYDVTGEALGVHSPLLKQLRDHARLHGDLGLHLWVAGYLERATDPFIRQLLLKRSGFGLCIKESLHNLSVRTTELSNDAMPVGRTYFAQHSTIQVIQTAWVENTQLYVNRVNGQIWGSEGRASWLHTATGTRAPSIPSLREKLSGRVGDMDIDTTGLIEDMLGSDEQP